MSLHSASRVLSRFLEKLSWEYVGDMTWERALDVLGFEPKDVPSREEVLHRWKRLVFQNHEDKGGGHEQQVILNLAKDKLTGGSGSPGKIDPPKEKPKPVEVVDTIKGKAFHEGTEMPGGVEWLFISKPEWVDYRTGGPGGRGMSGDAWVVFGKKGDETIVAGLRYRSKNSYYDVDKGGQVNVDPDWNGRYMTIPAGVDVVKAGPKAAKSVMDFGDDGKVRKTPQKYVAWPGGEMNEKTVQSVRYGSGGVGLKDMLLTHGLIGEEHPGLKGRKTSVEVTPEYNKDKGQALRVERKPLNKPVYAWEPFDYYVSINGKAKEKLSDATIRNLDKAGFFFGVFNYDPNPGVPKNLTKMRGGRFGITGGHTIKILLDSLTSEHALKAPLEKAVAEWGELK